jgi:hypothetical protein
VPTTDAEVAEARTKIAILKSRGPYNNVDLEDGRRRTIEVLERIVSAADVKRGNRGLDVPRLLAILKSRHYDSPNLEIARKKRIEALEVKLLEEAEPGDPELKPEAKYREDA